MMNYATNLPCFRIMFKSHDPKNTSLYINFYHVFASCLRISSGNEYEYDSSLN